MPLAPADYQVWGVSLGCTRRYMGTTINPKGPSYVISSNVSLMRDDWAFPMPISLTVSDPADGSRHRPSKRRTAISRAAADVAWLLCAELAHMCGNTRRRMSGLLPDGYELDAVSVSSYIVQATGQAHTSGQIRLLQTTPDARRLFAMALSGSGNHVSVSSGFDAALADVLRAEYQRLLADIQARALLGAPLGS